MRSARHLVLSFSHSSIIFRQPATTLRRNPPLFNRRVFFSSDPNGTVRKVQNKPPICTADELHYVNVANSDWRLALWRYHPAHPKGFRRDHPLLLLSGVGTNAVAYDLSPESSFARYMSGQGFDTWILEVRGAGLSLQADSKDVEQSAHAISSHMEFTAERATKQAVDSTGNSSDDESETVVDYDAPFAKGNSTAFATMWDESQSVIKLIETFTRLSERLSGFLSQAQSRIIPAKLFDQLQKLLKDSQLLDRLEKIPGKFLNSLETHGDSSGTGEIKYLRQMVVSVFEEGQHSISPPLFDLHQRFFTTIEDIQKQLNLMVKYDWDFDHYLEEDVPAVVRWSI